ncbi:unnamed protein product [Effrenium voratum]|uniref:Uncharacterized protein n=1 Tax=Effrenium voratum TaxID=2562239 RepID=A0AA36NEE5_9DINO|nr:unnamed protein product [Effrenium voratum]
MSVRLEARNLTNGIPLRIRPWQRVWRCSGLRQGLAPGAIKRMEREVEGMSTAIREIAVLKAADPNTAKLRDVSRRPGRLYLVFEFASDLRQCMKKLA